MVGPPRDCEFPASVWRLELQMALRATAGAPSGGQWRPCASCATGALPYDLQRPSLADLSMADLTTFALDDAGGFPRTVDSEAPPWLKRVVLPPELADTAVGRRHGASDGLPLCRCWLRALRSCSDAS